MAHKARFELFVEGDSFEDVEKAFEAVFNASADFVETSAGMSEGWKNDS